MSTMKPLALFVVTLSLATQSFAEVVTEEFRLPNNPKEVYSFSYETEGSNLNFKVEQSNVFRAIADGTRQLVNDYLNTIITRRNSLKKRPNKEGASIMSNFEGKSNQLSAEMCEKLRAADVAQEQIAGSLNKGFKYVISLIDDSKLDNELQKTLSSMPDKLFSETTKNFNAAATMYIERIFSLDLDASVLFEFTKTNHLTTKGHVGFICKILSAGGLREMLTNLKELLSKLMDSFQTCSDIGPMRSRVLSLRSKMMDEGCRSEKKKVRKFAANYDDADMDSDSDEDQDTGDLL